MQTNDEDENEMKIESKLEFYVQSANQRRNENK